MARRAEAVAFVLVYALLMGCSRTDTPAHKRIEPVYDQKTGKLQLLKYDSNGNGKFDTWSYMDGARVVRIEIDTDEDGKIDRWEYYGPDQTLEKVGTSRTNSGKPDAWTYTGARGSTVRVDVDTKGDGKVTRIEHYERDLLVSAEEDSDEDGKIDKWETYEDERLVSVAFDTQHRGTPDRRLIYTADGNARLEIDQRGDGHFVPAEEHPVAPRPRR
ncbi:MAG: hypothetical protein HY048_07895 [Acidobacteria bacterium]|nr:hypothetical protein [Acidobacteriota bacterium]